MAGNCWPPAASEERAGAGAQAGPAGPGLNLILRVLSKSEESRGRQVHTKFINTLSVAP